MSSFNRILILGVIVFSFSLAFGTGCSSAPKEKPKSKTTFKPNDPASPPPGAGVDRGGVSSTNIEPGKKPKPPAAFGKAPPSHRRPIVTYGAGGKSVDQKIRELEQKLILLNDKLRATQASLRTFVGTDGGRIKGVFPHPVKERGKEVIAIPSKHDPNLGFAHTSAVERFRDALIQFEAGRYSDAILEFSSFLQSYADHPMAGSAQFFIGEAYYKQGEYKLALDELKRVVISYDRSSHIPEALKRMSDAENKLKRRRNANEYRQQLLTLFPSSPAAASFMKKGTMKRPPRRKKSRNKNKNIKNQSRKKRNIQSVPLTAPIPSDGNS